MGILSESRWNRLAVFLWLSIFIGLAWILINDARSQDDEEQRLRKSDDNVWISLIHESGTQYLLKKATVVGFMTPLPGDPKNRNGIVLTTGNVLHTTISIEHFKHIVVDVNDQSKTYHEEDLKK